MDRKGQQGIELLSVGVITILIAIILLIMGLIIMEEAWDETSDITGDFNNATLTTVTEAGEELPATNTSRCGCTITSITAWNSSTGAAIASANITYTNCRVYFTGADTTTNNTDWNVTGTFTYGLEACEAGNETVIGTGKFGDYVDLMVLAIVIAIIISLILVGFATKKIR